MSGSASGPDPLRVRPQAAGPRIPVLLVESGRTYGGTEKVVTELARRMDRTRFQPWVAIPPVAALDRMAEDLRAAGVPVERLEEIMVAAFHDVVRFAEHHNVNSRIASYMLAIDRVAYDTRMRGIYA